MLYLIPIHYTDLKYNIHPYKFAYLELVLAIIVITAPTKLAFCPPSNRSNQGPLIYIEFILSYKSKWLATLTSYAHLWGVLATEDRGEAGLASCEFSLIYTLEGYRYWIFWLWAIFSEHIESHTKPYACYCGFSCSRMSNLNRHQQTKHSIPKAYRLRTSNALTEGGIHYMIRRHRSLGELIFLLQQGGYICFWFIRPECGLKFNQKFRRGGMRGVD